METRRIAFRMGIGSARLRFCVGRWAVETDAELRFAAENFFLPFYSVDLISADLLAVDSMSVGSVDPVMNSSKR